MGDTRPKIHIWGGIGLIIPWKSGVNVEVQTDGHACACVSVEGVFVPFADGQTGVECYGEVDREFSASLENCSLLRSGLSEESADLIERLLAKYDERLLLPGRLRVDRSRLADSVEAWVHVIVEVDSPTLLELFSGFGERFPAILTWMNSD